MPVMARAELEASPLADLHAIADQLGIDGFRRLRKEELIDAILVRQGGNGASADGAPEQEPKPSEDEEEAEAAPRPRRRRGLRSRRSSGGRADEDTDEGAEPAEPAEPAQPAEPAAASRRRPERGRAARGEGRGEEPEEPSEGGRAATGVVEVLANGSAFLRVDPPEPSDEDVYISAAQVRRCELVSGDRVSGPVRTPRRSERYPSLVRIDTINDSPADTVAGAARFEDLPAQWPAERLVLDSPDKTLEAIEWLTPLGHGSRAVICGGRFAGKTVTLRKLAAALGGREDVAVTVVLAGVRPEEVGDWQGGDLEPVAALNFAASADAQGQAVERALDAAKRLAARGAKAVVLIDTLDGLSPHAARRALVAARNLREGGSLTVIATAAAPLGGETTVIALDAALTSAGREPIVDLTASGTLRPELLVGEDGAEAISRARAAAFEAAS